MTGHKPSLLDNLINFALVGIICSGALRLHGLNLLKGDDKTESGFSSTGTRNRKDTKKDVSKSKDTKLSGRPKMIVVTGCDRGFGRLLVEQLAKSRKDTKNESDQYIVVALTLTETSKEELIRFGEESSDKVQLVVIKCDVTRDDQIANMAKEVDGLLVEKNATLFALVNNAGIADPGDFAFFCGTNMEVPKRVMDVNYFGMLRITGHLLPLMLRTSSIPQDGAQRKEPRARILNMSSVCGVSASPSNSSYNASKFAVEAWSDSLRIELKPFGIDVTKIRPGQISTDIQQDWVTNLLVNYQKASPLIRHWYGENTYSEKVVGVFEDLAKNGAAASLAKPSLVTNSLVDLLMNHEHASNRYLKPYYWIGRDAHTLWKALHLLPTTVADTFKRGNLWTSPPLTPPPPALQKVSHVTIRVSSIEKSIDFYEAWGLRRFGETVNRMQFFIQPKTAKTMVLLVEDSSMKPRDPKHCYQMGMTRLSFLTTNLQEVMDRLAYKGYHPITPVASDQSVTIAVYADPDGFLVYMDEFDSRTFIGRYLRALCWWNSTPNPVIFHWTVNVSGVKKAMDIFENLRFQTLSDQSRDQVLNGLLPAFHMDPSSTVIEHIRLCHLPGDGLHATLMEWVEPRTTKAGYETLNSMSISVANVKEALADARNAGMLVPTADSIEYRRFPVYGTLPVVTAFVEEGNCPVEFICFSEKY